ncbi:homeobox protein pknox2 [Anaeramoeba flamelloides]|uniref:Homeobox protein pknox2 n=1 Tax=Anaeramoeba flamelloides TaxID=1746091 RepID=A0AAV7Z7R8_9EUKA|nr:homeobox protein pknox2 [Anaeramoeba flamelloides]
MDNYGIPFQGNFESFPINFNEGENIFQQDSDQSRNRLLQKTLPQYCEHKCEKDFKEKEERKKGVKVQDYDYDLFQGSLELQETTKPELNLNKGSTWNDCFTLQRHNNQIVSFYGTECPMDLTYNSQEEEITNCKTEEEKEKKQITLENNHTIDDPQIFLFPSSYEVTNRKEEDEINFCFSNFFQKYEERQNENLTNLTYSQRGESGFTLGDIKKNCQETISYTIRKREYSQTTSSEVERKIDIEELNTRANENENEKENEKEQIKKTDKKQKKIQNKFLIKTGKKKFKNSSYPFKTKKTTNSPKKKNKHKGDVAYAHKIDWQRKTFKIKKVGTKVTIYKKRRKSRSQRLYTSKYGKKVLERWFFKHLYDNRGPYPNKRQRKKLSRIVEIPPLQVQRWFGQRRRLQRLRWEKGEAPKPKWAETN